MPTSVVLIFLRLWLVLEYSPNIITVFSFPPEIGSGKKPVTRRLTLANWQLHANYRKKNYYYTIILIYYIHPCLTKNINWLTYFTYFYCYRILAINIINFYTISLKSVFRYNIRVKYINCFIKNLYFIIVQINT